MKLTSPFVITPRLMAGLLIDETFISYDGKDFYFDNKDWSYISQNFHPAPGGDWQSCFEAILSFLGAFAESRSYGLRTKGSEDLGENSNLFPFYMGEWADKNSDTFSLLEMEISEYELIED